MADYSFMKSGLGEGTGRLSEDEELAVLSILGVFVKEAMGHAVHYVHSAGRTAVQGRDILLALKYVACPSYAFMAKESILTDIQSMRQEFEEDEDGNDDGNDNDNDDDNDDGSDAEAYIDAEEGEDEEWTAACDADDDVVSRMNAASAEFDAWQPADDMSRITKRAIEKAERIYG